MAPRDRSWSPSQTVPSILSISTVPAAAVVSPFAATVIPTFAATVAPTVSALVFPRIGRSNRWHGERKAKDSGEHFQSCHGRPPLMNCALNAVKRQKSCRWYGRIVARHFAHLGCSGIDHKPPASLRSPERPAGGRRHARADRLHA